MPILQSVTGQNRLQIELPLMAGDDFAYYREKIIGFFFWRVVTPREESLSSVYPLYSTDFCLDERSLMLGVRMFCNLVID
jgi:metal-dependent amidase/aminoacylase/carboxypeptidase family protein